MLPERFDFGVAEGPDLGDDLFHFVCRAVEHRRIAERRKDSTDASPVLTHGGKWAYCPAGASVGHDWRAVTPVSLADLRRAGLAAN